MGERAWKLVIGAGRFDEGFEEAYIGVSGESEFSDSVSLSDCTGACSWTGGLASTGSSIGKEGRVAIMTGATKGKNRPRQTCTQVW